MQTVKSNHIPESYVTLTHPSGLDMILYPMEGYNSAYALFATKYGSIDTTFKTGDDKDFVTIPDGIAHFLEHKMFENEDGQDAFSLYAQTGASANAFTSFDRTAYLFSCTDNFKQSLEILLDFVNRPYFTPETVQKEQGIIGQEIKMYQDDPDWRVFFGLLQGLYINNPVAIDIAGTVESIAEITADTLYRTYNTFYNLNNMVLVIAGNFSPDEAIEVADKVLSTAKPIEIFRQIPHEPSEVKTPLVEINLPIAQPMFQLGFKADSVDEYEDFATAIKMDILLEMIAGEASPLYNRLYKEGLINSTFYTSADSGRTFLHSVFAGESRNPEKVKEEIVKEIHKLKSNGLDPDTFDHCQKAAWGRRVGMYGSVSAIANLAMSSHFVGADAFEVLDIISSVTVEELEKLLFKNLDPKRSVLSVVRPN